MWRIANRACIDLTASPEAKGYKRLPAGTIEQQLQVDPKPTQGKVARATGVSRSIVGRRSENSAVRRTGARRMTTKPPAGEAGGFGGTSKKEG